MNRPLKLTLSHFAWRSMRHYWQVNLAVILGIAAATAVLTGALVVGDSVRGSLRTLTLDRLGWVVEVLLADHFFSRELAEQLRLEADPLPGINRSLPAILMSQVTLEHRGERSSNRTHQATLVGTEDRFWEFQGAGPRPRNLPQRDEIVLNESLANDLHVRVGDRITVRLPSTARIAGDSPLGKKDDRIESLSELTVVEVLPSQGLATFSLRANQAVPRTAFLNLTQLQTALGQPERFNAVLFAGPNAAAVPTDQEISALRQRIRPSLADAGIRLQRVALTSLNQEQNGSQIDFHYLSMTSDTMVISEPMEQAIREAIAGVSHQTVFTYLANGIEKVGATAGALIPYSTVAAVEQGEDLTPLLDDQNQPLPTLADDEIVLTRWAADDLQAQPGDRIRVTYFAPETTHGEAQELSAEFTLKAIAPLAKPLGPYERQEPARYATPRPRTNDPDLTPEVPGITDQSSIDDWDPPFPFDYRRIRKPRDEDYWDAYRTTPKAYVSKRTGERLWGSRFGHTTSLRIADLNDETFSQVEDRIRSAIQATPGVFGFSLLDVKRDGLKASAGTTPFNLLFLGFSFFIIAAALMLVCLLFRLSLEQRASEAGLLLAAGFSRARLIQLFSVEGLGLALLGASLGSVGGVAYAAFMLAGLRSWWVDAIVTPFLELHVSRWTLPLGLTIGLLTSLLTIGFTITSVRRVSVVRLLTRQFQPESDPRNGTARWSRGGVIALGSLAIVLGISAAFLGGEAQAGAFFGSGAAVLMALLWQMAVALRNQPLQRAGRLRRLGLPQLIRCNLSRNSTRSVLTVGLMATACFLIVAISAFRLAPTEAGTGGFRLLAQTDTGVFADLSDPSVRAEVWGTEATALTDAQILPLRMQGGDDASCRNLYQVQRPRLVGITPKFVTYFDTPDRSGFAWAASAAVNDADAHNPWRLLQSPESTDSQSIPVILDKNTALYSLHLYGGVGEEFTLDYGAAGSIQFRVVALLANSVFQGTLLVSEPQLLAKFPQLSGYQFFCIACPAEAQAHVATMLADRFQDEGLTTTDARQLLVDLLAVQNTYLSTFQSLGGLGLLLGTLGLIAVQMRSVLERQGELALMRAAGFSHRRLQSLVLGEHCALLLGGLGLGVVAAIVAVLPHSLTTSVRPPWAVLTVILSVILAVGTLSGYLTLRPIVRRPLIQALRGD